MVDVNALRSRTRQNWPMSHELRKTHLKSLLCFTVEKEEKIMKALEEDLGKPSYETFIWEILSVRYEIKQLLKNLKSWTKPKSVPKSRVFRKDKCNTELEAIGTVLIISSWSSPFQNVMIPLAGAIAAGNCVIVKPGELSLATEELFVEQIPKYLDRGVCQVLSGTLEKTKEFIEDHKFDFIFFSGASDDGIYIMQEAAKTLTPVCLDLGGKCPVYVDESADVDLAAMRIMWGKIFNCGQTPVAPDYVLCHADVQPKFLKKCQEALETFYGEIPHIETKDYGRIINKSHTQRLKDFMLETEGKFVFGGIVNVDQRFVQPTIICDVAEYDVLMQNEIFGPILPVITVNSSEVALDYVNHQPKPQAVYVFTSENSVFRTWKRRTRSGGIIQNDIVMLKGITGMTFGGIEASGMGRYLGKASLELFSHQRGVVIRSTEKDIDYKMRYPPYNMNISWIRHVFKDKKSP